MMKPSDYLRECQEGKQMRPIEMPYSGISIAKVRELLGLTPEQIDAMADLAVKYETTKDEGDINERNEPPTVRTASS